MGMKDEWYFNKGHTLILYLHLYLNNCTLQAVAVIDLPDSNGENAVAELEKEFGANHAIFLTGNVANAEELTGIVIINCYNVLVVTKNI